MTIISDIQKHYLNKIDFVDFEILAAHVFKKTREFVLAHPENSITSKQQLTISKLIKRRIKNEPLAYILGHKEFYGLDFIVNKYTLIPRPETELMVDLVVSNQQLITSKKKMIVDVGTGSGCIITSIANYFKENNLHQTPNTEYYAIDISKEALKIAKKNAKLHGLDKRIKFLHGSLLEPILKSKPSGISNHSLIITANLPYLSKEIYNSAADNVKKFEPKSALYSPEAGLQHYRKLLSQIKKLKDSCSMLHVSCYMEISPEQKQPITKLIKSFFPKARIEFFKDLAGKWRICKITL